jgi:hypothetical protein
MLFAIYKFDKYLVKFKIVLDKPHSFKLALAKKLY